jgi:phage shock protein A
LNTKLANQEYEVKTSVAAAMADLARLNRMEAQYLAETESWDRKAEAALRAGD